MRRLDGIHVSFNEDKSRVRKMSVNAQLASTRPQRPDSMLATEYVRGPLIMLISKNVAAAKDNTPKTLNCAIPRRPSPAAA